MGTIVDTHLKKIELEGINRTASVAIAPAPLSSGGDRTDDCNLSWTGISDKGTVTAAIDVDIPDQEERPLFPDDNALFMIPQPDNKDVITRITYELYDNGKKDAEDYTLIAQTPIGGWQPGKMYTYSLTVTSLQKPVKMSVSISEWRFGADNDVTVPRK